MKDLITILLILISISCSQNKTEEASQSDHSITSDNFDWLVGNWLRTNSEAGKQTFEYWSKKSVEEYIGFGCTIQNNDTTFKENLRVVKINEHWNLEVTGVNENPTLFILTNQTKDSFICENKNNEFPKKIEYSKDGDRLIAKISDENTEIPFFFEMLPSK